MREIPVYAKKDGRRGRGETFVVAYAKVDDADFPLLSQYRWSLHHKGYPKTNVSGVPVRMHRFLIDVPAGYVPDHIDRDKLNNQRSNLRLATPQQNGWNSRKPAGARTSRYKGVYWKKSHKQWHARIHCQNHEIYLGLFKIEEDAGRAYDRAAVEYYGSFAVLNFPHERSA
jgi:hypothetical protein